MTERRSIATSSTSTGCSPSSRSRPRRSPPSGTRSTRSARRRATSAARTHHRRGDNRPLALAGRRRLQQAEQEAKELRATALHEAQETRDAAHREAEETREAAQRECQQLRSAAQRDSEDMRATAVANPRRCSRPPRRAAAIWPQRQAIWRERSALSTTCAASGQLVAIGDVEGKRFAKLPTRSRWPPRRMRPGRRAHGDPAAAHNGEPAAT